MLKFFSLFILFPAIGMFLQSGESLAPTVIPLVLLGATIAVAYGLNLNGSRTATILGALATAYAALGPQISSYTTMPRLVRIALIVIGIVATTLNERAQGGKSKPASF